MKNYKKIIILMVLFVAVAGFCLAPASAAKVYDPEIIYHKHTYAYGEMHSSYKGSKCPAAWKTTVRMMVTGSPSELKKYSYGRLKLGNKVISKKWKYRTMTEFGKDSFIILANDQKGTSSIKGKILTFQGYDKKKKKWVNLGKKKIKNTYRSY
jgi:hypothetical protein